MQPSINCALPEQALPQRYALRGALYEGAHSTVYRGLDTDIAGDVALKFFEVDKRDWYRRELAAGFGLRHPNLVRCLDTFYSAHGCSCIVYDFVSGGTLGSRLSQQKKLTATEARACLYDLLSALDCLHQSGRIHCDLKPDNVLLRPRTDGGVRFVLGDFGAVCFIREATSQSRGHTIGSPAYMAPERFYDRFLFNSDLYSLGVLGYELLAGERPFTGSAAEVTRSHLSKPPDFDKIPDFSLRAFIERLMEKDPQRRLPSAQTALEILQRIGDGSATSSSHNGQRVKRNTASDVVLTARTDTAKRNSKPTTANAMQLHSRMVLARRPDSLRLLNAAGRPRPGLCYASHTEFIDPLGDGNSAARLILHDVQISTLSDDTVAYSRAGRVLTLNLGNGQHDCVQTACHEMLSFALDEYGLLWSTSRGWHYADRRLTTAARLARITLRSPNYLRPPVGCVLGNHFLISDGPIGSRIALYSNEPQLLHRWELDGPVLGMTAGGENAAALVLTLDSTHNARHSLWRLRLDSKPLRLPLDAAAAAGCWTPSGLYWVTAEGELRHIDLNAQRHDLGTLPQTTAIAVSPDQRYLCALSATEPELTVWEL